MTMTDKDDDDERRRELVPDPDLLPVPKHEFLTREQAERDPTVDINEHDE